MTFIELLEKYNKIQIPIIQRDYAQGRTDQKTKTIRETFVENLHKALRPDSINIHLDFIYGYENEIDQEKHFIPLDGQQRLTTLFLLHWYVFQRNKALLSEELKSELNKFSYETRKSSRDFCHALVNADIAFPFEAKLNKQNPDLKLPDLSDEIKNQNWFYSEWEKDPTVKAMLVMLDAIHMELSDNTNDFEPYLNRLKGKEAITFDFLDLGKLSLSDDLYVKMNARGKQLTNFENFKAKIEQYIENKIEKKDESPSINVSDKQFQENISQFFSQKMDKEWTDLFWGYRNAVTNDNSIDDEIMNFIRTIFANEYAGRKDENIKIENLEYLIGTAKAKGRSDYTDEISFQGYKKLGTISPESIAALINSLDALSYQDNTLKLLSNSYYFNEVDSFKAAITYKHTFTTRVLFHAYIQYLIKYDQTDGLYQWMRVIFNLTENSSFDNSQDFAKGIKDVNSLLENETIGEYNGILQILTQNPPEIHFFNKEQILEEKIKAHLIPKSYEWKTEIEKAEQHPYFQGQIGFLLEFSGILDFYEKNSICDWSDEEDLEFLKYFRKYSENAQSVFSIIADKNGSASIDYLWERAVLTKGNNEYFLWDTRWRQNMLQTKSNTRDYSWKRLLRIQQNPEKNNLRDKRALVKEVLDDKLFNSSNLNESLKQICNNQPDDWRKLFIPYKEVFEYCKRGYIRREGNEILLYNATQHNHKFAEINSYILCLNLKEMGKNKILPFQKVWYYDPRGGNPCCVIDDWIPKEGFHYAINFYYESDNQTFKLLFFNRLNNNIEPLIISTLLEAGFNENIPNPNQYVKWIKERDTVIEFIKELVSSLNNLHP